MIKKIIKKIIWISKIKFRFDLPYSKKILLFDKMHSSVLKEIINKDFNVINPRGKIEVYFWILIKQIFILDLKFITYCKNYIEFTSPKIVITFIDNNVEFYKLKKKCENINFISIQNGNRAPDWFKNVRLKKFNNLQCDHIFVFNKYLPHPIFPC